MATLYNKEVIRYHFLSKIIFTNLYKLPYFYDLKISFIYYNNKIFCNWLLFYILLLLHIYNKGLRNWYIYGKTVYVIIFRISRNMLQLLVLDLLYKILPLINIFLWKQFSVSIAKKTLIYQFNIANFPMFYELDLIHKNNLFFLYKIKWHIYLIMKSSNKYHCNAILSFNRLPLF